MADRRRHVVTGGAGFVGSHLCEALLAKGASVVAVDSLVTGRRDNLSGLLEHRDFTFVQHDVTAEIPVSGSIDVVFHLASPASPVDYLSLPIFTLETGSAGTRNALILAQNAGAAFVLASTSEVYGDPLVSPQTEDYWGNVNPVGPRSVYDEAKRYAEALTMAYHREHDLDVKIARIFNTYGPRLRPGDGRVVPNFVMQALEGRPLTVYGEGKQTRSFCYVEDLVGGLIALSRSSSHGPINLGNPDEYTVLDFARLVVEVVGGSSDVTFEPLPVDDPQVRRPDISRARSELGWEPAVPLAEGLRRTADWFRSSVLSSDVPAEVEIS